MSESEWQKFIHEGDSYLKTAVGGAEKRPQVFTPEILYNIVAMGIEKHVMGYLLYHNEMPDNHTMRDLMDAVRKLGELDDDLYKQVVEMDRFQEICSVFEYFRQEPGEDDVKDFLAIGANVQEFITARLPN